MGTPGKMMTTSKSGASEALPDDWVELGYIRVTKCLTPEGINFWVYSSPDLNRAELVGMVDMMEAELDY